MSGRERRGGQEGLKCHPQEFGLCSTGQHFSKWGDGRGKARKSKSKGEMGLRMYSLIKLFDIAILYLETKPKCLRMSFLGLS